MKVFSGKVIGTKMDKTVVVEVEKFISHPVYKKRYKRTKNYKVHSQEDLKIGDIVRFAAGKPTSKTKKWRILK